jgi:hypothetical protein
MGCMDSAARRRMITELKRLPRSDFEAVVDEVRSAPNVEELGVAALRAALESRAAESPWSPMRALLGNTTNEE